MKRLLALSMLASCTRQSPTTEAPIHADDAAPSTTASAKESVSPPIAELDDADTGTGDVYCSKDVDCDWDEPCVAKRCIGGPKKGFIGCDKSAPPPGTCTCIANRCTLRRSKPIDAPGCKIDRDCGFVASSGVCKPGAPPPTRIDEEGTLCRCTAGACAVEVVDAVACKKNEDCSWLDDPRRPASAAKVPRAFPPVKPCKDGGWDSVCSASGHCRIVSWKC